MEKRLSDKNAITGEMADLKEALLNEIKQGILPFWINYSIDKEHGGFYGRVDNAGNALPEAPKGLILNTRILWSFSAIYSAIDDADCLKMAGRALNYLREYFFDRESGGLYWMLDFKGNPLECKKKVYGHAFLIYSLAEYYKITGNGSVLGLAVDIFNIIENKFFDRENGGYFETTGRDWSVTYDMRLSDIDLNEKKSMNAHLHILEAYSALMLVWPDVHLKKQLTALLENFLEHIIDYETGHFRMFFNELWEIKSRDISLGHDIEGSWLLWEAAFILNNPVITEKVKKAVIRQADSVYQKGLNPDGSLIYEIRGDESLNRERHWWAQAEAMVGFLNVYQLTEDIKYYDAMTNAWDYIRANLIDKENGEWFYKRDEDNLIAEDEYKISEWKGPYHNTRACLELVRRLALCSES